MTNRERFIRTMRYQPVDRRPLHVVGPWPDTLARWHREGLPADVQDVHAHLGVDAIRLVNVSGNVSFYPPFQEKVLQEDDRTRILIDHHGRTVRDFKDHTSMPEWLDHAVKTRDDLKRVIDEHYRVDDLDARFPPEWEQKVRQAVNSDGIILIDGGCYYGLIRNLAGVEHTSLLLFEAPDLIHELMERYLAVVMEGFRRATKLIHIDVVGYGEDIAYKSGPLISPKMFREFILPRYRKPREFAQQQGIDLTWYDSDGDIRLFIPDYLSVGITTYAPCEVAANMAPVALRKQFGKDVRLIGGIDKREVAKGRQAIDAEIARNRPVIEEGGFLPAIDHSIPADISYDDYRYFLDAIRKVL